MSLMWLWTLYKWFSITALTDTARQITCCSQFTARNPFSELYSQCTRLESAEKKTKCCFSLSPFLWFTIASWQGAEIDLNPASKSVRISSIWATFLVHWSTVGRENTRMTERHSHTRLWFDPNKQTGKLMLTERWAEIPSGSFHFEAKSYSSSVGLVGRWECGSLRQPLSVGRYKHFLPATG